MLLALAAITACQRDVESRLGEIRALQSDGQFEASIAPLRVLLTAEPEQAEANYRLGVALVRTGRPSLAVWPLQKAAQSEDYAVQAGIMLSSTLLAAQDFLEAIRAAETVLAADPDHVAALQLKARALVGAKRPAEALADADRLLELTPDDSAAFSIRAGALIDLERFDEAEQTHRHLKEMTEAGKDLDKAARGCLTLAIFISSRDRKDEAAEIYDECLEKYPTHPVLQDWATEFYLENEQPEKALAIWRRGIEEQPENINYRSKLADLLLEQGERDEAEALLIETAEIFDSRASWQMMAGFYRRTGDTAKAREAMEKAIERAEGDSPQLRFQLADLLIAEGEYELAEQIAAEIGEPSYQNLLRGSLKLNQGDPKAALELFEQGLRIWPNNAAARYMAGRAAHELGDLERAISEFREAVRVDEAATDASLYLAQLYYELGNYEPAQQFADRQIAKRPYAGPDPYLVSARSAFRQGDSAYASRVLGALRNKGEPVIAMVAYAELLRDANGPEDAAGAIEAAQIDLLDPQNAPALRSLSEDLVTLGRGDEALAKVNAARAAHPENPALLDIEARIRARSAQPDEARKLFESALATDAEFAPALEGLGMLAAQLGEHDVALGYFERALESDPTNPNYLYATAQQALLIGERSRAIEYLSTVALHAPGHVQANNDLAWLLAEDGEDLDRARLLATRAATLGPQPNTFDTLAFVLLKQGNAEAAVDALERAIAAGHDSASLRYRLGLALLARGDKERAISRLRSALELEPFPEAEAARAELARLQQP